jgi:hypothetical protein
MYHPVIAPRVDGAGEGVYRARGIKRGDGTVAVPHEAVTDSPTLCCNGVLLRGRATRWITGSGARLCRL